MMVGLASFVNEEGVEQHALLGARVQVHEDDLERFDRLNAPGGLERVAESGPELVGLEGDEDVLAAGPADPERVDQPQDAVPEGDQPAGNASLETWRAYARTQGATDADLEGLSRNEIRDQYGE